MVILKTIDTASFELRVYHHQAYRRCSKGPSRLHCTSYPRPRCSTCSKNLRLPDGGCMRHRRSPHTAHQIMRFKTAHVKRGVEDPHYYYRFCYNSDYNTTSLQKVSHTERGQLKNIQHYFFVPTKRILILNKTDLQGAACVTRLDSRVPVHAHDQGIWM